MKESKNILFLIFAMTILTYADSFGQSTDNTHEGANYEFATTQWIGFTLVTSFSSGKVDETKYDKGGFNAIFRTASLKRLEELSKDGWEVLSVIGTGGTSFLLRRKK
jgi:hypothetical protein